MTREHRIQVAKYLNKLIKEENYDVIGADRKDRIWIYAISVNHEQKQIILRHKEYCFSEPAFMQFRKLLGE